MPTPRSWLPRTKEILAILRASTVEDYDRSAIEKLFEIQRRTALKLMTVVGPTLKGTFYVISRVALISWVEGIDQNEGQEIERRRHTLKEIDRESEQWKSVRHQAHESNKPAMVFPVTDEISNCFFSGLPCGIEIVPGQIHITFDPGEPAEALQKLYAIAMAFVNDFGSFLRIMQAKAVSKETAVDDLLLELEYDKMTGIEGD